MISFDPDDPESMRRAARELFADPSPRDPVRGPGPTREDYLRWDSRVGRPSTGTRSGEVVCDDMGVPVSVGPSRPDTVIFGGVGVTATELARVGLSPDDVPNLTLIPEFPERYV